MPIEQLQHENIFSHLHLNFYVAKLRRIITELCNLVIIRHDTEPVILPIYSFAGVNLDSFLLRFGSCTRAVKYKLYFIKARQQILVLSEFYREVLSG